MKNKSQKEDKESKKPLGKKHDDDNKPNADKNRRDSFNRKDMPDMEDDDVKQNDPDKKRIEIDDNPGETERKIPRMKH